MTLPNTDYNQQLQNVQQQMASLKAQPMPSYTGSAYYAPTPAHKIKPVDGMSGAEATVEVF